jgi:t-SNARE complex subunit (syntaxin)
LARVKENGSQGLQFQGLQGSQSHQYQQQQQRQQQYHDSQDEHEITTENTPLLTQQDDSQIGIYNAKIVLNERIIDERDQDLLGLERSIAQVNEIFRDLGTLVNEQQYLLGNLLLIC